MTCTTTFSTAEITLHELVCRVLRAKFGEGEAGWWREGIPTNIRSQCAARREEDEDPCASPYEYTTFIDLSKIIKRNWALFASCLPQDYRSDRRRLERDLTRLNSIRNCVMHPVKEKRWSEDDFEFVCAMSRRFLHEGSS